MIDLHSSVRTSSGGKAIQRFCRMLGIEDGSMCANVFPLSGYRPTWGDAFECGCTPGDSIEPKRAEGRLRISPSNKANLSLSFNWEDLI
jgi:hypothetical protein